MDKLRPSALAFKNKVGNRFVNILEAGVWCGKNSKTLLDNFNCQYLFLIDAWQPEYDGHNYPDILDYARQTMEKFQFDDNVYIVKGKTLEFPLWPKHFFDYIYLDDDHSYNHVRFELVKYYEYLKPGSIISGDNYEIEGVSKAVNEFCTKRGLTLETEPWRKTSDKKHDVLDWWVIKPEVK